MPTKTTAIMISIGKKYILIEAVTVGERVKLLACLSWHRTILNFASADCSFGLLSRQMFAIARHSHKRG